MERGGCGEPALPRQELDLVVVQFGGVMFYSDRMQAYREALRVLRPGGRMLFTCWNSVDKNPAAWATQGVVEKFFGSIHPRSTPFRSPTTKACASMKTCSPPGSTTCRWNCSRRRVCTHRRRCGCGSARKARPSIPRSSIVTRSLLPAMRTELEARLVTRFGRVDLRVPLSA
ncbi:MAG: methyltransferase domain-containing protein, partial [Flavobacteriales bacterium]|nr:methyltransferase domain-containing protein [Flavobacteriales bacterium]